MEFTLDTPTYPRRVIPNSLTNSSFLYDPSKKANREILLEIRSSQWKILLAIDGYNNAFLQGERQIDGFKYSRSDKLKLATWWTGSLLDTQSISKIQNYIELRRQ